MRLSFGRRLTVICLVSTLLTVTLGVAALRSVNNLAASLERVVSEGARNLDGVSTIRSEIGEMSSRAKSTQLSFAIAKLETGANAGSCSGCHSVEALESVTSDLESRVASVRTQLQQIRQRANSQRASEAADTIESGSAEWLRAWARLVPAAASGRYEDAHAVLTDEMTPAAARIQKAADTLVEQQRGTLDEITGTARAGVQRDYSVAIALLILTAAVQAASIVVVRRTSSELLHVSGDLAETTDRLTQTAERVSSGSLVLAGHAAAQAAALEQTSASGGEVAEAATQACARADGAAGTLGNVKASVEAANTSLAKLVGSMEASRASGAKVSDLAGTIEEIAFQTNLLALNASVEAARAGAAGAGFAVVADEVRGLSMRCSDAAKKAADLIEQSLRSTEQGRSRLEDVRSAIANVTSSVDHLQQSMEAVRSGSTAQAESVHEIAQTVVMLQDRTTGIATSADENARAGEDLSRHSAALTGIVTRLTDMVGRRAGSEVQSSATRPRRS